MTRRSPQNVAASVRQRLLNLAHQRREEFQFVLTRFALERLLYRLSTSPYADRFLLKGALLFTIWSSQIYRPTRDLDLSGRGEASPEQMREIFRDLCHPIDSAEGVVFDQSSIRAERIRELQQYPGVRIFLDAHLDGARIPLQIDIGFGDAVTPDPAFIDYPTLLDHPAPRLKAYPQETVIAEKFHAMVFLGAVNSRVRDFYDLWLLSQGFEFAGETIVQALHATFKRRQTNLPGEIPIALTEEFSKDLQKLTAWNAFLRRVKEDPEALRLTEVCTALREFLMPPARAAASGDPFSASWVPPGPWLVIASVTEQAVQAPE